MYRDQARQPRPFPPHRMVVPIVRLIYVVFALSYFSMPLAASNSAIRIGILQDEMSPWMSKAVSALRAELNELGGQEFSFVIAGGAPIVSTGDRQAIASELAKLMSRRDVDLIVTMGPTGSDVVNTASITKPTIAAAVVSAEQQGFSVTEQGTSGRENVHYLAANIDLLAALQRFREGTESAKLAVIVEESARRGVPAIAELVGELASQDVETMAVGTIDYGGTGSLLAVIPEDADAVFMLPQMARTEEQRALQVNELLAKRLPVLSTMGSEDAEAGFLYSIALIPSPQQIGRRLALDIRDIALGRPASSLLVSLAPRGRLTLNMATARAIDADLPFDVLFEANVIGELAGSTEIYTLLEVLGLTLERNLGLAVAQERLVARAEDTEIARSELYPQLSAGFALESFDDDLAIDAEVIPSETATASFSLSQSIYSESKLSNYRSQQFLQMAEEAEVNTTELDVVENASNTYLNVLIAKTELEIQRDNIRLTRANLERAQFRYRVGSADRSEVFRFETLLASDLQSVASARATLQQAQFALNEVLRRPIAQPIGVGHDGVYSPSVFGDERIGNYINGSSREQRFADFVVSEALNNSPEVMEIQARIASQERLVTAAKRRRYVPTVDLVGSVEEVVADSGASRARNYDEDWQIALEFSLPLYQGSAIAANRRQARSELRRLKLLQAQTELQLETEARDAVAAVSASRLSIKFAEKSEEAANRTLSLVTDSYSRGRSSYIDLIDAQTSYLSERLAAANASYQYLLDLIALQRSIGFFNYAASKQASDEWFSRLDDFVNGNG